MWKENYNFHLDLFFNKQTGKGQKGGEKGFHNNVNVLITTELYTNGYTKGEKERNRGPVEKKGKEVQGKEKAQGEGRRKRAGREKSGGKRKKKVKIVNV